MKQHNILLKMWHSQTPRVEERFVYTVFIRLSRAAPIAYFRDSGAALIRGRCFFRIQLISYKQIAKEDWESEVKEEQNVSMFVCITLTSYLGYWSDVVNSSLCAGVTLLWCDIRESGDLGNEMLSPGKSTEIYNQEKRIFGVQKLEYHWNPFLSKLFEQAPCHRCGAYLRAAPLNVSCSEVRRLFKDRRTLIASLICN